MPLVRIKPNVTHRVAEKLLKAGDEFDASPAEMESFGDKFELVEPELITPEPPLVKIDATLGARALAQAHSVSLTLSDIVGTGKDGKIVKADVQALLNGDAE